MPLEPINEKEVRLYARAPEGADDILHECIQEMKELSYRVCYAEFEIKFLDDALDLGFAVTRSKDLRKALDKCEKIILFASTVGNLPDRLTARYTRIAPSKALFIQAIGAERVEALCDAFCKEIKKQYADFVTVPRFSPGYGDLPLFMQKDIFATLDCPKNIGVTLNDSLLMLPTKSVTAIIGLKKDVLK